MERTAVPPPHHVRAAFGIKSVVAEPVGNGTGWRCGDVTLRPAADPVQASWEAQTLDALRVPGVRIGRPVRATDGRWVVGHWSAMRHLDGQPEPWHDEVVSVAVRLHRATGDMSRPKFLDARDDTFAVADRAAWGEQEVALDPDLGGRLFTVLSGSVRPTGLRSQLVHGDLFGTVLFAEQEPPAVVDFVPFWRPAEWAAAVVVVDALAWGGADDEIIQRWSHLAEWPHMLLRALLFRLAGHALHPHSTAESLHGLQRASQLLVGTHRL